MSEGHRFGLVVGINRHCLINTNSENGLRNAKLQVVETPSNTYNDGLLTLTTMRANGGYLSDRQVQPNNSSERSRDASLQFQLAANNLLITVTDLLTAVTRLCIVIAHLLITEIDII